MPGGAFPLNLSPKSNSAEPSHGRGQVAREVTEYSWKEQSLKQQKIRVWGELTLA